MLLLLLAFWLPSLLLLPLFAAAGSRGEGASNVNGLRESKYITVAAVVVAVVIAIAVVAVAVVAVAAAVVTEREREGDKNERERMKDDKVVFHSLCCWWFSLLLLSCGCYCYSYCYCCLRWWAPLKMSVLTRAA